MPPFTFNPCQNGNFFGSSHFGVSSCRHFVDSLCFPQRGKLPPVRTLEGDEGDPFDVFHPPALSLIRQPPPVIRRLPPDRLAVPGKHFGLTRILVFSDRCAKNILTVSATGSARMFFPRWGKDLCRVAPTCHGFAPAAARALERTSFL